MTFGLRLVVIGLASFAAAGVVASLTAWALATCGRLYPPHPASRQAARLAAVRLLPSAVGTLAFVLVVAALLAFEPRHQHEAVGDSLTSLASFAAVVIASAAWRTRGILRRTRHVVRVWLSEGTPIEFDGVSAPAVAVSAAFPIVAVIGVFRPRLVVARTVLDACTPDELRAILAHEQGHIDRRDNLRRLLLHAAPDLLAWLPVSSRLLARWHDAIEDAADDDADRAGAQGRIHLASALIKVARLAPRGTPAAYLPASALYRGEDLSRRVRRLLHAPDGPAAPTASPWKTRLGVLATVLLSAAALEVVHELVEAAVRRLP